MLRYFVEAKALIDMRDLEYGLTIILLILLRVSSLISE